MKRVAILLSSVVIGVSGLAMVGCQSSAGTDLPPGERANTSGGNGAFGEDPVRPGRYSNTNQSSPATQPSGNPAPSAGM